MFYLLYGVSETYLVKLLAGFPRCHTPIPEFSLQTDLAVSIHRSPLDRPYPIVKGRGKDAMTTQKQNPKESECFICKCIEIMTSLKY